MALNAKTCLCAIYMTYIAFASFYIYSSEFVKVSLDVCSSTESRFHVLYGLSVNNCMKACGRRPDCKRLNHHVTRTQCGLYNTTYANQNEGKVTCVIINREDIDEPMCNCTKGMACQSDGSCQYEECAPAPYMDPIRGIVLGNMQSIGSKVKVVCKPGYVRVPDNVTTTCGSDGQWEDFPECLWDCGAPCQNFPYTTRVSDGGQIEKDQRNYTCIEGFYVIHVDDVTDDVTTTNNLTSINNISSTNNLTEMTTNLTAVCSRYGWTYWRALCVNDTVAPRNPESIQYVEKCYVYEINNITVSQTEAEERCLPYGRLARLDTFESQTRIQQFLNSTHVNGTETKYWIQGYLDVEVDPNVWRFSDGVQMNQNQTFWDNGQPNRNVPNNSCIAIESRIQFRWDDRLCSRSDFGFICEYL